MAQPTKSPLRYLDTFTLPSSSSPLVISEIPANIFRSRNNSKGKKKIVLKSRQKLREPQIQSLRRRRWNETDFSVFFSSSSNIKCYNTVWDGNNVQDEGGRGTFPQPPLATRNENRNIQVTCFGAWIAMRFVLYAAMEINVQSVTCARPNKRYTLPVCHYIP